MSAAATIAVVVGVLAIIGALWKLASSFRKSGQQGAALEQREQADAARERMDDVEPRDPADSLRDHDF